MTSLDRQALVARHLDCGNVVAVSAADDVMDAGMRVDLPADAVTLTVAVQGDNLGDWCDCGQEDTPVTDLCDTPATLTLDGLQHATGCGRPAGHGGTHQIDLTMQTDDRPARTLHITWPA